MAVQSVRAGDINGDGVCRSADWGSMVMRVHTGRSYVVFGGSGVGSGGLIALSGLNGSNGFKLDGEVSGDYSGLSVSAAGDINGDGVSDLLIGALVMRVIQVAAMWCLAEQAWVVRV